MFSLNGRNAFTQVDHLTDQTDERDHCTMDLSLNKCRACRKMTNIRQHNLSWR